MSGISEKNSEVESIIEMNGSKAHEFNLNPRTRTGRGTRLCSRHLDPPRLWSTRDAVVPAVAAAAAAAAAAVSGNRIEVT